MEELRYKPVAFYPLDTSSMYQDVSGYNNIASITGAARKGVSLNSSFAYSQRFDANNIGSFAANIYAQGAKQNSSFSISASIWVTGSASEQEVASKNMDGITINGTKVYFTTKYANSGEARCYYDVQIGQKIDVVGVHTSDKNSLYVNGVLVSEVDITAEQKEDVYATSSDVFKSGQTAGTQKVFINSLVFYSRALLSEEVTRIYLGNNNRPQASVPKMLGGGEIDVSTETRAAFLSTGWFTEDDWSDAVKENVTTDDGVLVPQMFDGETLNGIWQDSVDLYAGEEPLLIDSINMFWYGENVTVEVSVDNETWAIAKNGENISVITAGFDPTGKDLYIKVTFDGGKESGYIDSLQVRGYLSPISTPLTGRPVTYNNPSSTMDEFNPAELRDNWGVKIGQGGSLGIGLDPAEEPEPIRTIELWVKPDDNVSVDLGLPASSHYQNGESASANLIGGEWVLYHQVLSADQQQFSINIKGQIGRIATYPTALTPAEIKKAYTAYLGYPKDRYDGTGLIKVEEPTDSVKIYAYDWAIISA